MLASSSPERFVGCYVLLRLCVPRYPPLALGRLTWIIATYDYLIILVLCSFQGALLDLTV